MKKRHILSEVSGPIARNSSGPKKTGRGLPGICLRPPLQKASGSGHAGSIDLTAWCPEHSAGWPKTPPHMDMCAPPRAPQDQSGLEQGQPWLLPCLRVSPPRSTDTTLGKCHDGGLPFSSSNWLSNPLWICFENKRIFKNQGSSWELESLSHFLPPVLESVPVLVVLCGKWIVIKRAGAGEALQGQQTKHSLSGWERGFMGETQLFRGSSIKIYNLNKR